MKDNKGSITIEIAIILIIILLIMGVILKSTENATDKIIKSQEEESMETLLVEVVDNLINNPGTPDNWHEKLKGTIGLAIVNEEGQVIPNSISWDKFSVVGKNYNKLITENLFDSKIKSSMELIPQRSSISSIKIGSQDESSTVFTVNRLVKCDFYKKYVLKDFQNGGKCNRDHDQSDYSCNYFKVFESNLKDKDYYLLIDEGEKYHLKYIVDTTRVVKEKTWQTTTSDKIYLNDKFSLYDDTSAVVFIHFDKPNPKAVLVSVPKYFDDDKLNYDYFRTNDCQFVFKAWYSN